MPHNETRGEIFVDVEFHKNMFNLHMQVKSEDVVVGWFSTRLGVGEEDALIHDFYAQECVVGDINPVMLSVDAALVTGRVALKAFSSAPLTLGLTSTSGKSSATERNVIAAQFHEVSVDASLDSKMMLDTGVVGLEVLSKRSSDHLPDEQEGLHTSLQKLKDMVDVVTLYIDEVVAKKREPDVEIGKYLMDTLSSVPLIENAEELQAMVEANMGDIYVMKYIVQLTRSQLFFGQKLRVTSM